MTQHPPTFVRLDLPPIPDLWRGTRALHDRPAPVTEKPEPARPAVREPLAVSPAPVALPPTQATAAPAPTRPPSGFPRPTLGRRVVAA